MRWITGKWAGFVLAGWLVVWSSGCSGATTGGGATQGIDGVDNEDANDNDSGNDNEALPENPSDEFALWSNGVRLRGANIYQRRVYDGLDDPEQFGPGPLGPPMAQTDFDALAALGANYVNISHPGMFTEKPPYVVDNAVQNNLDALLEMIARADMFAVVAFRSGPGRGEFALFVGEDWYPPSLINDAVWEDAAAQEGWAAMWRYTAQRYRDNPIVVGYDLMVEPNANHVFFDEFNPEAFYATYGGTLYDWNQMHPRIVNAIREVDAETPVLIECMSYSSVFWLADVQLTGDDRTVYAVHNYEPFVYTHQAPPLSLAYPGNFDADFDGTAESVNAGWLADVLSPLAAFQAEHGAAVAVNEYGVQRYEPGADGYLSDELAIFEELGANHAIWFWGSSFPGQAELDEFDYSHGPDPNHHAGVVTSDVLEVIRANWSKNDVRPSTMPEGE